jgi:hypothetical protein
MALSIIFGAAGLVIGWMELFWRHCLARPDAFNGRPAAPCLGRPCDHRRCPRLRLGYDIGEGLPDMVHGQPEEVELLVEGRQ